MGLKFLSFVTMNYEYKIYAVNHAALETKFLV